MLNKTNLSCHKKINSINFAKKNERDKAKNVVAINLNNDKHQSAQVKRTKAVDVVNCNQREMQLT